MSGAITRNRTGTRSDTWRVASEVTRARRRASFIASIRRASQVEVSAARADTLREPLPPARAAAALPARRVDQAGPRPRERERASEPPRGQRASTQLVETRTERVAGPPPAPARAQAAAQQSPALFRAEALQHRLSSEEGRGLVRVSPPWTWALLWIVLTGVAAALVASFVGRVEVTGRGRGIVRPASGVHVLTSQLTGAVVAVDARSGDLVRSGAPLLRVESASVQAQLLEAERGLEAVRTRFSEVASQQDRHYAEQIESLRSRAKRLTSQIASLRGSVSLQERRVEADRQLLSKGLVSDLTVAETRDSLAQADRQLTSAESALDQTRQELASLEARRQDELWQRQQLVAAAQNKRDALALVMRQSVISAPEDGTVEALLVKVGDVVQAGQPVGKIVPVESRLHVVSFLAEKDRAFAKPGDEVELELDQLPHAEYGTLKARVTRISDDLASPSEIGEAIGEGQRLEVPSYRVELEITDAHAADAAGVKLRTGALLNARFTLRRQRLITLVLSPLKRWFR